MSQNSEEACQNRLLDLYFAVLNDKKHFTQRVQPLGYGTEILKSLSQDVRKWKGISKEGGYPLYAVSPSFQIDVKARFGFGGEGLGPMALANVHHALSQFAGLYIKEDFGIGNTEVSTTDNSKSDRSYTPENIKELKPNQVFVFGANTAGGHGGGTAGIAQRGVATPNYVALPFGTKGKWSEYGVVDTLMEGTEGKSFGIVTKYASISGNSLKIGGRRSVTIDRIEESIDKLIISANNNPELEYLVTKFGTNMAGFTVNEMKAILQKKKLPDNIVLPVEFETRGKNTTNHIHTTNYKTSLAKKYGKDGELISEWFSALIDAHVDIAADPFIYYLNCNKYTRDVIQTMIRMGVGGVKTMLFASQPILEEYTNTMSNEGNKLGITEGRESDITKSILEKYTKALERLGKKETDFIFTNEDITDLLSLENGIKAENKDAEWYAKQIAVMRLFLGIKPYAQSLTQAVMASRVDTKGFGNNISQLILYRDKLKDAMFQSQNSQFGIGNFKEMVNNTFLGRLTENSIDASVETLKGLVLEATPAFIQANTDIRHMIGKAYNANDKLVSNIAEELYVNINSDFFINKLKLDKEYLKSLISGKDSIPKIIYNIKAGNIMQELRDNPLIQSLSPHIEQDRPDLLTFIKPDDKWHKDEIASAWKDMLLSENDSVLDFAYDLFYYSYFTSGFKNGVNTFFDLAPRELLVDTGYNKFISDQIELMKDPTYLHDKLNEMFVNAWNNDDLVPLVNPRNIKDTRVNNGEIYLMSVDMLKPIGENASKQLVFRPYIKTRTKGVVKLYKYIGYKQEVTKKGVTTIPVYYAIEKKSYYNKGQVVRENNLTESVFGASNKLKFDTNLINLLNDGNIQSLFVMQTKDGRYIMPEYVNTNIVTNNILNLSDNSFQETEDKIEECGD